MVALAEGCASLFVWCTQVLHLCEGSAYNRIEVARAARRYPAILALIEGRLDADHIALVAPPTSLEEQARGFASMMRAPDGAVNAMLATLQGLVGRPIDRESWLRDVAHLEVPLLVV